MPCTLSAVQLPVNARRKVRERERLVEDPFFRETADVGVACHKNHPATGICCAELLGHFISPDVREGKVHEKEMDLTAFLSADFQSCSAVSRREDLVAAA